MSLSEATRHVLGTPLDAFAAFCADQGLPNYRAKQVYEWVFARGVRDFGQMTNLSKPLRKTFAEHWSILTSTEVRRQESTDGTTKLLLRWSDGATSECVLIPEGKRRTACISTQVGCPVQCAFCASGLTGLQRQLTAGEIVEQAFRIRAMCSSPPAPDDSASRTPASVPFNIVVMGMGEPLANYGALMTALRIINANWGLNIGARRITVSTVGLPAQIRKLARENLQINLAISLHAPTDTLRAKLIPWAKRTSIADLVAAGREYFDITGREITIEYLLLGGVNDKITHANELVRVCRKMRCNVNLIRYNPVPGLAFERPTASDAHFFLEQLRSRGVNVHLRRSRGLDIDAACGQLRRADSSAGR